MVGHVGRGSAEVGFDGDGGLLPQVDAVKDEDDACQEPRRPAAPDTEAPGERQPQSDQQIKGRRGPDEVTVGKERLPQRDEPHDQQWRHEPSHQRDAVSHPSPLFPSWER